MFRVHTDTDIEKSKRRTRAFGVRSVVCEGLDKERHKTRDILVWSRSLLCKEQQGEDIARGNCKEIVREEKINGKK